MHAVNTRARDATASSMWIDRDARTNRERAYTMHARKHSHVRTRDAHMRMCALTHAYLRT